MSHQNRYLSRNVVLQVNDNKPEVESNQTSTHSSKDSSFDENSPNYKAEEERASLLSWLNFLYVIPLIPKAWRADKKGQELTDKDLITLPYKKRGEVFEENYMKRINKQQKEPKGRINSALAVLLSIKWMFLMSIFTMVAFCFLRIFLAYVVKRLIECYLDPERATTDSYWWAAIAAGTICISIYFEHHWNSVTTELSAYTRAGIISMLYNKVMRLSTYNIQKLSAGQLINIVANDVNTIEMLCYFFPGSIGGIINLIAGTALLWIYFGVTCLLGVGYVVLTIPVQIYLANKTLKLRRDRNDVTDMRITRTRETIQDIRLLKMYTWELKFQDNIQEERKKDVGIMNKVLFWESIARGIGWATQAMAAFLIFMLYHVTGGDLTISKAFSAYFVLGSMRLFTAYFMYGASNFFAETGLLFTRINKIMRTPDMGAISFPAPKDSANSVEFDKYTGYWTKDETRTNVQTEDVALNVGNTPKGPQPALVNINLNLKKGSLNSVVGSVGSGKSSLLLSFTKELPETTGELRYNGSIAYVEQEPTIFAGTVRESILFGKEYNEEFYKKVIKACNLESDLKLFPQGDMSMIGERGNNLSGGQKARIALARAVYSDADIYLLDDPLSAVDAKVAHSIYHDAIRELLKEKTVILVTHQVHFVRDAEVIIVMDGGKVIGNGTFDQLKEQGVDVDTIFSVEKKEDEEEEEDGENSPDSKPLPDGTLQGNWVSHNAQKDEKQPVDEAQKQNEEHKQEGGEGLAPLPNADPYAGKVTAKTYGLLIKEVGYVFTLVIFALCLLTEFGDVAFGRILGAWTAGTFNLGKSLGALGGIAGYLIVVTILKNFAFTFGLFGAAQSYHNKMLDKIIKSPTSFFDTNPVGRILNRFSNDLGVLDKFFPQVFLDVADCLFVVVGVFITLAIIDPILLGPIVGVVIWMLFCVVIFFPAIKLTKRYDFGTRAPLFSLFSASMSGIAIIRNYGQTENFRYKFRDLLYTNTKGNINFYYAAKLLGFCVDVSYNLAAIGMIYITTARIKTEEGPAGGGIAAFTLALTLSLAGIFQYGVKMFCQANILMSSAASVQAYTTLPSEAPLLVPQDEELKKKNWPHNGDIEFKKVFMKYRPDTDFVIKDLSLLVDSGEKIGCVGRTGAGKSTITNLLYRLQEIDKSGSNASESFIKIDGTSTLPLGLHLLRGNISIIPQTPFIFAGTIKENIDPLGQFSDQQVWDVLEEVRLKEHVNKLPENIHTNMSNASSVFSTGQKQLVCLARTLLKPGKLLVLDEATANMDTETDNFIQKKIMEKFANSTVFTIAHRLATIANYDKVLVLDKGRKVEFDEPYKLLVKDVGDDTLTNPTGHFGSMVMNTGPKASQLILNIAKDTYEKKHGK